MSRGKDVRGVCGVAGVQKLEMHVQVGDALLELDHALRRFLGAGDEEVVDVLRQIRHLRTGAHGTRAGPLITCL